MPALKLTLIHPGTKREHEVIVRDVVPWSGKYVQRKLLVEWHGSGQAQYVLNLNTNTLHKAGDSNRLRMRAGLWQAKDLDLATKLWYELRQRKNQIGY